MAKRAAVPMAVGVLMIVFATLALGATALAFYAVTRDDVVVDAPRAARLTIVVLLLPDLIVSCVELSAGIALVRYRAAGPERAMHFAIMRIIATVAGLAFVALEMSREVTGVTIATSAVGLAWPVIVLALLSRLRLACDPPRSAPAT